MHLGIDFGTSYTKLGFIADGKFINLAGADGQIPTVVTYLPAQEKLFFGPLALRLNEPGAVQLRFFKLELRRNPGFRLGPYFLKDIVRSFFVYLHEQYVPKNEKIDTVTVSVPNYFGLKARKMLREAIEFSFGVTDVYLIPEPVAALLGYNMDKPVGRLDGDILCIDLGGGTTDFSFVSLSRSRKEVVMESQFQIGHDAFSGSELDRVVLRSLLNPLFTMQHGYQLPASIISEKNLQGRELYWFNRLIATAEKIKIEMGKQETRYFNIPGFYEQDSLVFYLTAEVFCAQLAPAYRRLEHFIEEHVKQRAGYLGLYHKGKFMLDFILLLGGASQTRGVRKLIADLFPDTEIICPQDLSFNVVKGLAQWGEKDLSQVISVKSIYPFNFYLERWDQTQGNTVLDKIPFDTDNLQLDIKRSYKIFTIPLPSHYNLANDAERLQLRVYELAQGDPGIEVDHFLGQDLVLNVNEPLINSDKVELYLNLNNSCIEIEGVNNSCEAPCEVDFTSLFSHLDTPLEYLKLYPGSNPQLIKDYEQSLKHFYLSTNRGQNYPELLSYKLLAFLQLLKR